jgi:phage terminase small subunit
MSNNVQRLLKKLVLEAMSNAQESTGTRIQKEEKLAKDIAEALLDEQDEVEVEVEEETEEEPAADDEPAPESDTDAEAEVDIDAEEEAVEEPAEEEASKVKRKMSTPKIAVGTTYKDFKHNFNAIRSAKAISKTVNGEMMITKTGTRLRDYFEALTGTEKKALQEFMVGLSQVLLVGTQPDDAVAPDIKNTKPAPAPSAVDQNADGEIGTPTPIRVVGSKLESLLRLRRKNML